MGTYTAHYSIYKPADSETGYMTAFNTGMDNISTNIYNNATSISTLNTFKSAVSAVNGIVQCNGSGTFSAFSTAGMIKNCVMSNGTSTMQTINGTSYVDVTGSSVSYTPPSGSSSVFYMFRAHVATGVAPGYGNIKLLKNGSDVSNAKQDVAMMASGADEIIVMYVFTAWSGAQIVKVQARAFSASYPFYLNTTYSVDGVAGNVPVYNQYIMFSI